MTLFAATRKGTGKSVSEDRILIDRHILKEESACFERISPRIIGIADGVGGNAGGGAAAQFLCEKISQLPPESPAQQIHQINEALLHYAAERPSESQMASVFSGILFGSSNYLIHAGNTRICFLRRKYLRQMTHDQTIFQFLMQSGRTEEAEHCRKNEIFSCFGGGNSACFQPEITEFAQIPEFIITSDGIHDYVDTDTLEALLFSAETPAEACRNIMQKALERHSTDDMSIVISQKSE